MANDSIEYRYSGYFMAYRYCYNALASAGTNEAAAAAARVASGENEKLKADMAAYSQFFAENRDDTATAVANAANDTYLKTSGEESGIASYGEVADLLYSWYYQQVVLPNITVVEDPFDPFDETQVDLSGIVNAKPRAEEPAA
jgi:predicted HAD superfamily Cof-like phosphohydrolase